MIPKYSKWKSLGKSEDFFLTSSFCITKKFPKFTPQVYILLNSGSPVMGGYVSMVCDLLLGRWNSTTNSDSDHTYAWGQIPRYLQLEKTAVNVSKSVGFSCKSFGLSIFFTFLQQFLQTIPGKHPTRTEDGMILSWWLFANMAVLLLLNPPRIPTYPNKIFHFRLHDSMILHAWHCMAIFRYTLRIHLLICPKHIPFIMSFLSSKHLPGLALGTSKRG